MEFTDFVRDESGATAIEYGIITTLIAAVIIPALLGISGALDGIFAQILGSL